MCVDYRRLNAVSPSDAYPTLRVDDLIDRLGGAKYITTLDLSRGYWQLPVDTESRHLTGFTTPFGLFQFKVMPFRLHGAPGTFQRLMDRLYYGMYQNLPQHISMISSSTAQLGRNTSSMFERYSRNSAQLG